MKTKINTRLANAPNATHTTTGTISVKIQVGDVVQVHKATCRTTVKLTATDVKVGTILTYSVTEGTVLTQPASQRIILSDSPVYISIPTGHHLLVKSTFDITVRVDVIGESS